MKILITFWAVSEPFLWFKGSGSMQVLLIVVNLGVDCCFVNSSGQFQWLIFCCSLCCQPVATVVCSWKLFEIPTLDVSLPPPFVLAKRVLTDRRWPSPLASPPVGGAWKTEADLSCPLDGWTDSWPPSTTRPEWPDQASFPPTFLIGWLEHRVPKPSWSKMKIKQKEGWSFSLSS